MLYLFDIFDTHGAQYHDEILGHCIDIPPYQYVLQIPTLCLCSLCVHTYVCAYVCICIRTSEFKSPRVCMSRYATGVVRTFSKHSSSAIFNEHLVRQVYQG